MTYRLAYLACVVATAAGLSAGCTFDDSGLADKDGCARDEDCINGQCVDGICLDGPPRPDAADDTSEPDTSVSEDAEEIDTTTSVDVSGSEDAGECNGLGLNACGGCGTLTARPGDECGLCGRYSCSADRSRLVCNEVPLNACGGCGELAHEPGDPCGECANGTWTCTDGDLVCAGDSPALCGDCTAPRGALEGADCACAGTPQPDPAVWSCGPTGAECEDGGGLPDGIRILPASSDSSTTPVIVSDFLQTDGDIDIIEVRVVDTASNDRLEPRVTFRAARAGQWACLAWTYDDGRSWEPSCLDGGFAVTIDGIPGCCADDETALEQGFALLRDEGFSDGPLDVFSGENNDNGYAWLIVSDEGGARTCTAYSAELRF